MEWGGVGWCVVEWCGGGVACDRVVCMCEYIY